MTSPDDTKNQDEAEEWAKSIGDGESSDAYEKRIEAFRAGQASKEPELPDFNRQEALDAACAFSIGVIDKFQFSDGAEWKHKQIASALTVLREENERLQEKYHNVKLGFDSNRRLVKSLIEKITALEKKSLALVDLLTQAVDFMKQPPAISTGDRAHHQHDVIVQIDKALAAYHRKDNGEET